MSRFRPWWFADALAREPADDRSPPLPGDVRADLAIVGGGFTGLWTAILAKQAEPRLDIVLIEADVCGAGASGRNGGCVMTWTTKFMTLRRLYGEAEAIRLARASEQAILDIEAFIDTHGIACDWRRDGTLYTATSAAQVGASDAVMAELERRGISSWRRLPPDEVRRRAGSAGHLEGWYSPLAATVQPALLARGLRRVALDLGVRIHEHTALRSLAGRAQPALVTDRGRISAGRTVLALNAWTAGMFPSLRRTIAIVSSDMVITEPAPAALRASGLDGGISVLDSRTFVHYYRSTPDGRLMLGKGGNTFAFGGRMHPVFDAPSPYRLQLAAAVTRFMPGLASIPIASSWNGPSDRSVTGLPFFGPLPGRTNVWYGFGYSGNGVGPTRMGGQVLADLALGRDTAWTRSLLARGPLGRFPPEPIRFLGSLLVRNAIRRKEADEDAGRSPSRWDVALAGLAAAAGKADKA